jgi:hypothetical protein
MGSVSSVLTYSNVVITFVAPDNSGATIMEYQVVFYDYNLGIYREDATLCNGKTEPTFSSHICSVNVFDFMSKFGYTQGQTLLAKVRALNYRGYGDFSTPMHLQQSLK